MGNTFGKILTLTTFGESHGPAMGGILDGMPPKVHIDLADLQTRIARRRPGSGSDVSQRRESDSVEILSGIDAAGNTLGSPIGFIVRNEDARSADYDGYAARFRPNHADYTYYMKYGVEPQPGGGRASARETVSWVIGGSIVYQWLRASGINIEASYEATNDAASARLGGDSTGGVVRCTITGLRAGLGEPVFDKLHSRLAAAMMGINAAKGFEYGDGCESAYMFGSQSLDLFRIPYDSSRPFASNHSGGIQGGISNGMPINFSVYFKPTPTLMRNVDTIDINGNPCVIPPKGRHDPCVAIRAAQVVESMAALVTGDLMLLSFTSQSRR